MNEYQFLSRWMVPGTCGEVADVLGEPIGLARWWPSVYLKVDAEAGVRSELPLGDGARRGEPAARARAATGDI